MKKLFFAIIFLFLIQESLYCQVLSSEDFVRVFVQLHIKHDLDSLMNEASPNIGIYRRCFIFQRDSILAKYVSLDEEQIKYSYDSTDIYFLKEKALFYYGIKDKFKINRSKGN